MLRPASHEAPLPGETGTRQHPLYFLHVPKAAGSSITRLLEDAFPVGSRFPHAFVDDFKSAPSQELDQYPLFCGHFGRLPIETIPKPLVVLTLLRDPAARAWSHFRALHRLYPGTTPGRHDRDYSFRDFLDDQTYGWAAANFQARWLGVTPERDLRSPSAPGLALAAPFGPGPLPLDDAELERRARATLDACALVGTTDRIPEFVDGVARLLRRWLPEPVTLNADPFVADVPDDDAAAVRVRSAIDLSLIRHAGQLLDRALATLPPLPRFETEPMASLPYEQTMSDPLAGTGWHARVHTADAGWHRWTGPATTSTVRLPARLGGPCRIDMSVVTACDRAALAGLEIRVQGRSVPHALADRPLGVSVLADVDLHADVPVVLELRLPHTRPLLDPGTLEESEEAGLAVGTIRLSRQ